ncbi:MAG: hypothetical protein ABII20_04070, partial [Candidatus Omnitrophota bacterium]
KLNFLSVACFLAGGVLLTCPDGLSAAGQHKGEQKQIGVDIQFSGARGETVTDAEGITYKFYGYEIKEAKIYPSEYRGTYPLYFFGMKVPVKVIVTNKGPRSKAKIRVATLAYCLNTDGTNGFRLKDTEIVDVEVNKGETKEIDASFVCNYSPEAESGLDRFIVQVLHMNSGKAPRNQEAALIMTKEGIFCPPEYIPESIK